MTKEETFKIACDGDKDALLFLVRVDAHLQAIRKLIESESKEAHELIALMAQTNTVFSLPFYARNAHFLYTPLMKAVNDLMDADPILDLAWNVAILKLGFEKTRKLLAKEVKTE